MSIYYTIYLTTNLINNKKYIGQHKTSDPQDSYLGSGDLLKQAIEKYGRENFTKEVLHILDTQAEANEKELALVNEDVIQSEEYYNIALGGRVVGNPHTKEVYEQIAEKLRGRKRPYHKGQFTKGHQPPKGEDSPIYGIKRSDETKEKNRQVALNRPKRTCPHCNKTIAVNVYSRCHGDKCLKNYSEKNR